MTNKPTHTPTPWKHRLGRGKYPRFHIQTMGGYQIASTPKLDSLSKEQNEGREHDAAFIVRAVNSYDAFKAVNEELLNALKSIVLYVETYGGTVTKNFDGQSGNIAYYKGLITKAEGK